MRLALVLLAALSALSACNMMGRSADTPVLYEVRQQPDATTGM